MINSRDEEYTFTNEEAQEIRTAREKNRDKNVDKRLAVLEMGAEGKRNKEISEKTGFVGVPVQVRWACKHYRKSLPRKPPESEL